MITGCTVDRFRSEVLHLVDELEEPAAREGGLLERAAGDPSLEHGCHGWRHEDFAGTVSGCPMGGGDTAAEEALAQRAEDVETMDELSLLPDSPEFLAANAAQEEIIAFCKENLAPYKIPKFVEFRQELPKTLVGKVLRRELIREHDQAMKK